MELRNIRTFIRTAELNSFSRAAEELGYTQSAVTVQIKSLETELDAALFERIGRGIRLTQKGETFLEYARHMLECEQEAISAVSGSETITGNLRIGTAESICSHVLPKVMSAFARRCPEVKLQIETIQVKDMFTALKKNMIDLLLFVDLPAYDESLVRGVSMPLSFHFVVDPENPLAGKKRPKLSDIFSQRLVLTEKGLSYRDELDRFADANGFALDPSIICDNADLIMEMIMREGYTGYLPDYMTGRLAGEGHLVRLNSNVPTEMQMQILYHRHKQVTKQMQVFIELLRNYGEELI